MSNTSQGGGSQPGLSPPQTQEGGPKPPQGSNVHQPVHQPAGQKVTSLLPRASRGIPARLDPDICIGVISLILWVAVVYYGVQDPKDYVDDSLHLTVHLDSTIYQAILREPGVEETREAEF
ncbi:hypothetical protein NP233_g4997 [Leucocoprinus birnbaumii]|uniref:Uncharacterized protein n=1 Tax=Leucocoprinus birnbaumii TaxID=56174 RepID=A0AAD5YSA8_9AGAR|nr:hypothetical protein NP233_g4997 [Leucocoprinus birnbaumii]